MATAHPAKFPDAMERATGQRPVLPPRLSDLFEREENFVILPNDMAAVQTAVRSLVGRNAVKTVR
jgi:threonine synthase